MANTRIESFSIFRKDCTRFSYSSMDSFSLGASRCSRLSRMFLMTLVSSERATLLDLLIWSKQISSSWWLPFRIRESHPMVRYPLSLLVFTFRGGTTIGGRYWYCLIRASVRSSREILDTSCMEVFLVAGMSTMRSFRTASEISSPAVLMAALSSMFLI